MNRAPAIEVAGLDVAFGRGRRAFRAVRDASFSVTAGSSFGLVGESGSGKTTVLRALAGLLPPAARFRGELRLHGGLLRPARSRALRRRLQLVFQDPYGSLHPRHTVDRILGEPARVHGLDSIDRRTVAALADVGLDPSFRFRFPHQLSGGQRQRIAIARALIIEPAVVLLDEPTSALDVSVQAEILNLLQRLRREYALTFVLVSHDLAVVSHMCEALAVMRAGEVVETVSVDALRADTLQHRYSRQLLQAAQGYRSTAAGMPPAER
ncbi:MAG: ABC transporter ATP-binding protein [Alphaproteobacteria bacterium]|nr:ABC transporter ATP-binding protein [Alphaproteobacteria bacterium]